MATIYQASTDARGRHSGLSLSAVLREARLTAEEKGVTVRVESIEVASSLTLAYLVKVMNGESVWTRTKICEYQPVTGDILKGFKVRKVTA